MALMSYDLSRYYGLLCFVELLDSSRLLSYHTEWVGCILILSSLKHSHHAHILLKKILSDYGEVFYY
jgi:hypothetical protein